MDPMTLIDSAKCMSAGEGVLGSIPPSRQHLGDIEFGWRLLRQIVQLGIGDGMVVRERDVVAVEAAEDTAALIERAGKVCRLKGWVLLKTAGAESANRLPTIDVETIQTLAGAGGGCLAVSAQRVQLADKTAVIEAADRLKVALVGVIEGPSAEAGSGTGG